MDTQILTIDQFYIRVCSHISKIYKDIPAEELASQLFELFKNIEPVDSELGDSVSSTNWSEEDTYLITYGNSITDDSQKPLQVLKQFLSKYVKDVHNTVHILPFFPYSSDDGFSVIDYREVNKELGNWNDIQEIASRFNLMSDLVINHISSESKWFKQFVACEAPGKDYFLTSEADADLTQVVRPRTSPLLRAVETKEGLKHVWCTFSHDQVDMNFTNPEVFLEFVRILQFYLEKGVRVFRLDAVAFLWKEMGTPCINLYETHEIIKLFRLIIERYYPDATFITETNVPNIENIKYFGNSNEAHIIYNFSLPPLLLHALWKGSAENLVRWSMSLPPAPMGCTYLNFTASHDGIGLRPVEGLLDDNEIDVLVSAMHEFGGEATTRAVSGHGERPYEINITWMDAMRGTEQGEDEFQLPRFLCSQILMMGLEGIPAFYIQSILAGENDYEKLEKTKHKRSINRREWLLKDVEDKLSDTTSKSFAVFNELRRLIKIRTKQKAFHPNATQFTLHLGNGIFGIWRQSADHEQSLFAIHNLTNTEQELFLYNVNLTCTDTWTDLVAWDTIDLSDDIVKLKPYQCMWITNKV